MYVLCMNVCMYVCMYVCVYGCLAASWPKKGIMTMGPASKFYSIQCFKVLKYIILLMRFFFFRQGCCKSTLLETGIAKTGASYLSMSLIVHCKGAVKVSCWKREFDKTMLHTFGCHWLFIARVLQKYPMKSCSALPFRPLVFLVRPAPPGSLERKKGPTQTYENARVLLQHPSTV